MVRRPLFYMTVALTASTVAAHYIGEMFAVVSAAVFIAAAPLKRKGGEAGRKTLPAAAILAIFYGMGAVNFCAYGYVNGESIVPEGKVEIIGTVKQVEEKRRDADTVSITMEAEVLEVCGRQAERREVVLVSVYIDEEMSGKRENGYNSVGVVPGDVVWVAGEGEEPAGRRNPGCFDYALYLKSIGVERIIRADEIDITEASGRESLNGKLYMMRESFMDKVESRIGTEMSAMVKGILFGDTDGMDEDTLEEFRMNGTAHILSVSGLHIGIIYGVISWLWRWRKGWVYFAMTIAFFCCYMMMASFSPPVVRAVLMVGLHLLAKVLNRRYDLESATYLAALVLMMENPMTLFNTGFQMSFMAMLSMAVVIPAAEKLYRGVLLSGISVQIGLLPYTAYMFNYISLGAVIVNIPIVFLSGLIVPLGLAAMAAGCVADGLFEVMADVLGGLCRMMVDINSVTTIDGVTVFTVTSPDIRLLLAYYILLLMFLQEEGRLLILRKRRGLIVVLTAAALAASVALGTVQDRGFDRADMVFVDVGQGDCIHIRTENGKEYMIDGGGSINYNVGEKTLKPYLLKNGTKKLDGMFVTHTHTDHYKGAVELCREGMVEKLFVYEGNKVKEEQILADTGMEESNIVYLYGGQTVGLSPEASVEVLSPERRTDREYRDIMADDEDENSSSLVMKVTVSGRSVLVTGDIEEECQEELAEDYGKSLECDIMKVAHHGSRYSYSERFTELAAPEYAVFQVGKNNFGHPDNGVIENYERLGIIIYRNDEDGAVAFDFSSSGRPKVMTVRQNT